MRTNHNLFAGVAFLLFLVASMLSSCSDLNTDLPAASTADLKVHEQGWVVENSPNFHGKELKQTQYNLSDCASCHSKQFTGGVSGVSCFSCHPGYPHPSGFRNASGHPATLYSQSYPFNQCKSCHGVNYAGDGDAAMSCMKSGCHVDATNAPKSPEACNTCHGTFSAPASNFVSAAPPASVQGDVATSARGVGAHQKHLVTGTISAATKCEECHVVPTQVSSPGHLGALPAEIVFNDVLARLSSAKGSFIPNPSYNASTLRCSDTYCHGSWKLRKASSAQQFAYTDSVMVGASFAPAWTAGPSGATCGSCHGLPPKGHVVVPIQACGTCHLGIVSNDGVITDKTKHLNGKINVFGQEYAF